MAGHERSTNAGRAPSSCDTNIDSGPRLEMLEAFLKRQHSSSDNCEDDLIQDLDDIGDTNADVNVTDIDGNTVLHLSVMKRFEKAVRFLLKKGAQTNIPNNDGETPIDLAGDNLNILGMLVGSSPVISLLYSSEKQIHHTICYNQHLTFLNINCTKCYPDFLSCDNFYTMLENARCLRVVVVKSKCIGEMNDRDIISRLSTLNKTLVLQFGSKVYVRIKDMLRTIIFSIDENDVSITNVTERLGVEEQFSLELVVTALLFGCYSSLQGSFDINMSWGGRTLIDHAVTHNDYLTTHFLSTLKPCLTKVNENKENTLELAVNHADPNTMSALLGIRIPTTPLRDNLETCKSQIKHLISSLRVVLVSNERRSLIDRIDNARDEIELWKIFDDMRKLVGIQLQTDTDEMFPSPGIADLLNLARSRAGETLLMIAVERKDMSLVHLLIQCGADVNYLNVKSQQRAIDIAWGYDDWDFDMLTVLLEADSEWPVDFSLDYLSENKEDEKAFRNYVKERDTFHHSIRTVNLDEVIAFCSRHTTSRFVNIDGEPALETAIDTGDANAVRALIELGIPYSSGRKYFSASPCQQTDMDGNTLLMTSARLGHRNVVKYLLQCRSDVEHPNNDGERAIDHAWKNNKYDVVLMLLAADSDFPKEYDKDGLGDTETEAALKSFIEDRNCLHINIKRGILQEDYLKEKKSKLYLNSEGNSALFTAITSHHFDIYVLLKSDYDVHFKNREEITAISELTPDQKEAFNKILIPCYSETKNSHILYLLSKSRSSKHIESFDDKIRSIYDRMNSIEQVSRILNVIPYIDSLDVIFDFDESVTLCTDAEGSVRESGSSKYNEGRIYIGAKVPDSELLGTLTHELSHLVMQMMFNNGCNPYDTEEGRIQFQKVVEKVKEGVNRDIILENAFRYPEPHIDSELIVRVPHMLAKYGSFEGSRLLSEQAPSLLNYYKNVIEPRYASFMEERFFVKPLNTMKQLNTYLGAVRDIEKLNIFFKTPIDIGVFLNSGNKRNILCWKTRSIQLCMMNIYQGLREKHHNSFIFLKANHIEDLMMEIVLTFKSKTCSLMVVGNVTNSSKADLGILFGNIAQYLSEAPNKKVIFISNDATVDIFGGFNSPEQELKHELSDVISDHEFTLKDFTDESQSVILSRDIIFQGHHLTLNQLIDNLTIEIDSECLTKLINDDTFSIGNINSMPCDYHPDYYIPRYFHKIEISDEILKRPDLKSNVIVISGVTAGYLKRKVPLASRISEFTIGNNVSYESEPTRLVVIDDDRAENNFESFCSLYPTYNIHWLKNESGRLIWQKTHGLTSSLLPFRLQDVNLEQENHRRYSEVSLLKHSNQMVIISDTAGMGKTTVLTEMIQHYKDIDKSIWIERIDLNDYSVMFDKYLKMCETDPNFKKIDTSKLSAQVDSKEYRSTVTFEKILHNQDTSYFKGEKWKNVNVGVKFLIQMLGGIDNVHNWDDKVGIRNKSGEAEANNFEYSKLRTAFEKDLFARCFQFTGQVILCFDGFDEISPKFKFIVNSLLKLLRETKVRTMLVTTRPHMRRGLEEQFGTLAYTFTPLTTDQQRRFLCKFWGNHPELSGLHTEEILEKHATTLIDLLANSINDQDRTFTGIPLQIKMLAEAFVQDLNSSKPKFPVMLDMIGLYEKFIKRKYEILAIEKKKTISSISAVEDDDDKLYSSFINDHIYAALYTLFYNEEEIPVLLPEYKIEILQSFLQRIQIGKERTGIITQHIHDGKPHFIHRTFAEYFAAEFLANCLSMKEKRSKSEALAKLVLTSVLIEPKYQVVRSFLNDRIAKWPVVPTEQLEMSYKQYGDCIKHTWLQEQELMFASNKHTAFHISAEENNAQIINFLLVCLKQYKLIAKEMMNFKDATGKTALHMSAEYNQIAFDEENEKKVSAYGKQVGKGVVQLLVEAEADINITDIHKRTPLYIATEKGHFSVVKYLVGKTIASINDQSTITYRSIDTKWDLGWTPLHVASSKGYLGIVRLLKTRPDVLEVEDHNGKLPIDVAVSNGYLDIVQFLKPHNNIDYLIRTAVFKGDVECLAQYLGNNDIDINIVLAGMSHLHMAAFRGYVDIARLLIKNGANVQHRRDDGFTPAHAAASHGHLEVLQLFAEEKHESLNVKSDDGWQVLHAASQNGYLEIVRYLIEVVNQNVNLVDFKADTPLHTAAFHNQLEVVKYLMDVENINRNPINKYGVCPIMVSAFHNNCDVTEYLLNREDVSFDMHFSKTNFMNDLQMTVLHIAAAYDALGLVELLVEKGFQIDVGYDNCFTPLHSAALFNSSKVADYLIARGARVDAPTNIWKLLECALGCSILTSNQVVLILGRQVVRLAKWSLGFIIPNFTPHTMYESCGYTQCPSLRISGSGLSYYRDIYRVRFLNTILNNVFIKEPLRELKNYVENRKRGTENPIGAAFLVYAPESAKPKNREALARSIIADIL